MESSPRISDIRDTPGPEVAVMARRPAQAAPQTPAMAEISSSVCKNLPPVRGRFLARYSMISEEGVIG